MRMGFRATDLPELRREAVLWYATEAAALVQEDLDMLGQGILHAAELYYVAPPMMELAVHASKTLPDFALEPEDLPAPDGFLYCPEPFWTLAEKDGGTTAPTGFAWGRTADGLVTNTEGVAAPGIALALFSDRDADLPTSGIPADGHEEIRRAFPRLREGLLTIWQFGERQVHHRERMEAEGYETNLALIMKSVWLLMQQELAATEDATFDRGTRRRLARQDIKPGPVRVVRLRRKESGHPPSSAAAREYHHQWVVRGHWRQQWYATREVHRPVWIAPHIKGPAGAPLLGGERVYTWVR